MAEREFSLYSISERVFELRFRRLPAETQLLLTLIRDPEVTGSAYAWSNMAYYIAKEYHEAAVRDTSGDFVTLDLGSALPIWSAMLRDKNGRLLSPTRRYLAISLDIESPDKLVNNARRSFPPEFRRTPFYIISEAMRNHMQADLFALPFAPNSVSFLTSFEVYPFYFGDKSQEEHLEFAKRVIEVLKPGGAAVFFPWSFTSDMVGNGKILAEVKNFWVRNGMNVSIKRLSWGELVNHMGLREEMLMNVSPIFTSSYKKTIPVLILTKPK